MGSRAALPLLKNGSLPWKPTLAAEAEALRKSLEAAGPNAWAELDTALAAEGLARHEDMLAGIEAYRHHPYHRDLPEAPVLWRQGTTRLRDYRLPEHDAKPGHDAKMGREGGQPVLVVPSLVNRAYILDLTPRRSLMRYFAARGLAPFLVDWDAPGPEETAFTLSDYVAGRLEAALEVVATATKRKVAVVGYCMGGNLALALALRRPDLVASLTLMATPWDFHAGAAGSNPLMRALEVPLGGLIEASGALPVDLLQAMFASLDPNLAARKFAAFARLKKRSARARDFVALEDWANDGVALAGPVARECLSGWYGANSPKEGVWHIAGEPVLPERLCVPTLVVIPERDRIVPPESSRPLAEVIPGARVMTVRGGHVGMLMSGRAKTDVYAPLAKWVVRATVQ
ncbi:MAG: alpha/beta fold hydrolase [Rhodospirillaceae bacterium]|nr:alpha/beta fold hydrolase [Rhodospirillales bacterium]